MALKKWFVFAISPNNYEQGSALKNRPTSQKSVNRSQANYYVGKMLEYNNNESKNCNFRATRKC